jgi:hypothetical protein
MRLRKKMCLQMKIINIYLKMNINILNIIFKNEFNLYLYTKHINII